MAIGHGVVYKLGRGGFNKRNPSNPGWDGGRSDCSGFVSWVLMIKRAPKLIRPFWIETTAIYQDAIGKQRTFKQIPNPIPGCVVVFPDRVGREGHIGIVSEVSNGAVYHVVDCASKGITEHSGAYFVHHNAIFCVLKEDYE